MSLLQMKHICKSFSGVYANEDINLTVEKVRSMLSLVRTEPERPHLLILYLVFTLQTAVKFCGKTSQRILPLQGKLSMQALEWSSSIFPW